MEDALPMMQVVLNAPGGPEQLTVKQDSAPLPGPQQVLIGVEAAGVAFYDITARQGRTPGKVPYVLGSDVVGRVLATGADVNPTMQGQRVAALLGAGGYATHVVAAADRVIPIRCDVPAAQADALVLNYVTAWQLLHRVADVKPGQTILVLGAAGGVGSALLELALLDGITVYGTASASRRPAVEAAGGHWVADASNLPGKVDAVFDPVGGPSLARSRRAAGAHGVVVSFGFSFTVDAGHSKYGGLARTAAALLRAKLTPGPPVRLFMITKSAQRDPAAYRDDLTRLVDLLADEQIRPAVTTMPLAAAADAHRRLEARQIVGKLVLVTEATA